MTSTEGPVDLERNFSAVALALFASGSVTDTVQRIVDLAQATVDGCEAAGIVVVDAGQATTAAASDPLVVTLDQMQIDAGEGPCLDAAITGAAFYAEDLVDDRRWPIFGPQAVEVGIRSVLAYSLPGTQLSALNLYARLPVAFGANSRAQGLLFATLAGIALGSATEREADERRAGNLHEALRTRELIGQAQGILMERERIGAEAAFDVLRQASQHMNVKLRDVAETLVETGERPEPRVDPDPDPDPA